MIICIVVHSILLCEGFQYRECYLANESGVQKVPVESGEHSGTLDRTKRARTDGYVGLRC